MPNLALKNECCGCAACSNVCVKQAIAMLPNETGFLYPTINKNKCVECKMCEKVCPALNRASSVDIHFEPRAFIGQHLDSLVRNQSTSGGIFTAIAETIINEKGVVFGAAMNDKFVVYHTYVESVKDLAQFRNSKYVQSQIGDSFEQCKKFLNENRKVCFSGTPCQIHGLKKYLNREYDNLITVDIVCHSVPSPLIFQKYVELQKAKYPKGNRIVFRDKAWGYSYSTMAIYDDEKCLYRSGSESDLWFRSFLPGLCDRENCYKCNYQDWPRISDITIWDCFVVGKIDKEFDDNKGTTSIMVWSRKGSSVIEKIGSQAKIKEVSPELFKDKIYREHDEKIKVNRVQLYKDAANMDAAKFFNKYRPNSVKVRVKRIAKRMLYITGLYNLVKNLFQ